MCGRYALRAPPEVLREAFELGDVPETAPRYNIAPSQPVLIVRADDEGNRSAAWVRWGLVPAWSRGPDSRYSMINARAETVAARPAYRSAYRSRRCLVPADGFYEWCRLDGGKQPWFIHRRDDGVFAFAGLWERWQPGDDRDPVVSCTILTVPANALMAPIHERMPMILPPDQWPAWLDRRSSTGALQELLQPRDDDEMIAAAISTRVNNPRHDDPDILLPA